MKFFILIFLLVIINSALADELKIEYNSGTGTVPYQSSDDDYLIIDGKRFKNNKISVPDKTQKDDKSFKGYPYYGNPHSFTPKYRNSAPIIIKEKETTREIIREVPVETPQPVKEKNGFPRSILKKSFQVIISTEYLKQQMRTGSGFLPTIIPPGSGCRKKPSWL